MRSRLAVTTALAAAALVGGATLSGCSSDSSAATSDDQPHLKVSGAYMPQPPLTETAAAYFTVDNTGGATDRLTRADSDLAPMATLDTTTDAGAMKEVKSLAVPAGGTLRLRTGSDHVMLMNLKRRPEVGDTVTLHLTFAKADPITVKVPVKPATYQPAS
ncbi:copper chaperone PCu(A)C [Streptomyces sp. NPDC050560]|uniref:copper chaperone PCu(A)C n=1 Tax=Streptomyces sp. NPDC050560 TaxID=3365630 RepID=UPI0037A54547